MKHKTHLLSILGAASVVALAAFIVFKVLKNHDGEYEHVGKNLDERLKSSRAALEKASNHIQSVFEHFKHPNS